MKKSVLYGLVTSVSVVSVAGAADPVELATRNYVDSGLRAVYQAASNRVDELESALNGGETTNGLLNDVSNLKATVGDENSGLVKQVNALTANSKIYSAGDGVDIAVDGVSGANVVSVSGAAATTESANQTKMFVFQNGTLVPMETVSSADWGN